MERANETEGMALPQPVIHPNPIRAIPGSDLTPDQIVGRDALAAKCWEAIGLQNIRLENERRIGKTLLMKRMIATAPPNTRCVLMEVGGVTSAKAFVDAVLVALAGAVPEHAKTLQSSFDRMVRGLSGLEVGGFLRIPQAAEKHWRPIFLDYLTNVAQRVPDRIVFFWDEIPWMFENIGTRDGQQAVNELLSTLRDIRQMSGHRFRMVFTGSIGFHHGLGAQANAGLANGAVNDMHRIEVPPLDAAGSRELVHRLAAGEHLVSDDLAGLAEEIHAQTGGVAFYMHHVVAKLGDRPAATRGDVIRAIDRFLRMADDPWSMRHYRERMKGYYGSQEAAAQAILDAVAEAQDPVPFAELFAHVQSVSMGPRPLTKSDVLRLLDRLQLDHYLAEPVDRPRHYGFKFPLVKRWWRFDQGLDL